MSTSRQSLRLHVSNDFGRIPLQELPSIANIVPANTVLTIADIGASQTGDEKPIYEGLIASGKARLIAFEPDGAALDLLRLKYPPPHICLPMFVGDGKPATFFETNWGPTGSLFEPNTSLLAKFHNLAELTTVVRQSRVDTVSLDQVREIDDLDFIKIDAQGAEHLIFSNAPRIMSQVTLVHAEVCLVEMYRGAPLFAEIDQLLRAMGFQWHTRVGCGYRPFLPLMNADEPDFAFKQELWADVVYVRNWMSFDGLAHNKLIKLGVLLHDLYHSYDLAYLAMASADRQSGTNYADNYAKWLVEP